MVSAALVYGVNNVLHDTFECSYFTSLLVTELFDWNWSKWNFVSKNFIHFLLCLTLLLLVAYLVNMT